MSRRETLMLRVLAVLLVAVVAVVWASSYYGRSTLVESLRAGCQREAKNTVAALNVTRADQRAKYAISRDPKQKPETRAALAGAARIEQEELLGFDERIVTDVADLIRDPEDHAFVEAGKLTCKRLYPDPSVVSFH